ncbi:MAG: hypothetical protein HFG17_07630 [Oscillospiraceae bacterium]|jgi:hypothetical protein|nr:hypothetical protein [Oscillospiraceae bacterium]
MKLKQIFCRHKNSSYYQESGPFQALNMVHVYRICDRCGKILSFEPMTNEEFRQRFRSQSENP